MYYLDATTVTTADPYWRLDIPDDISITGTLQCDLNHFDKLWEQITDPKQPYDIADVQFIRQDGEPIGTIVTFVDGTREKAVCCPADRHLFSIEQGLTICLCKKLLGSSGAYNSVIQKAVKTLKRREREERELARQKEEQQMLADRRAAKKKVRMAKRELAKREKEIEIRKEAYKRAMEELGLAQKKE